MARYRGHTKGNLSARLIHKRAGGLGSITPPGPPPAGSVDLFQDGTNAFADDASANVYIDETDPGVEAGFFALNDSDVNAIPVESAGGYFFADDGA